MADAFTVEIVSPERLVLSQQAEQVSVPGTEGYFTVMAHHAPLMSTLKPGFITVTEPSGSQTVYYVRGGFADVTPDSLTILAEDARQGSDFDRGEVETAIREAQTAVGAAETPEDKDAAQQLLDGWNNLMVDAMHHGPTVNL